MFYPYLLVPKIKVQKGEMMNKDTLEAASPLQGQRDAVSPGPVNVMPDGLAAMYRRIPPEVVADLMIDLGLFASIYTDEDKARHNVAVQVLRDIGVLQFEIVTRDGKGRLCPKNMKRIIEAMCHVAKGE